MELSPGDRIRVDVNGVSYPLIITEVTPSEIKAGEYNLIHTEKGLQILNYSIPHTISLIPRGALIGISELDWDFMLGLPLESINSLCLVNTQIQSICQNDEFWREKVDRFYGVSAYKPQGMTYREQFSTFNPDAYPITSIRTGRIDELVYLMKRGLVPNFKWTTVAVQNNQIEILDLLASRNILPDELALDQAAANGQLNVLQWAAGHGKFPDQSRVNTAARNGRVDVLNWAAQHNIYPDQEGFTLAANGDRYNVLEWGILRGLLQGTEAANAAAQIGNFELVESFARQEILPDEIGLLRTLLAGHFDIADWIYNHGIRPRTRNLVNIAAGRGRLDVLIWYEKHGLLPTRTGAQAAEINGYYDVISWLRERRIYPN